MEGQFGGSFQGDNVSVGLDIDIREAGGPVLDTGAYSLNAQALPI